MTIRGYEATRQSFSAGLTVAFRQARLSESAKAFRSQWRGEEVLSEPLRE